jgi:RNA polymerase sigma-70 factor (ECF subfamily)
VKERARVGHAAREPGAVSHDEAISAGVLFRRHAAFVANFLVRLGVDRSEVDDVVQDVFMIAHRRGGYRPGAARPTTWLADIALRVNANRRRGQRRSRVSADMGPVERALDPARSPGEALQLRQSLDRVQEALEGLDEEKRAVFILFELEGESCDSIAAGLGVPVGTVYSRLHGARKQFAKAHARLIARERRVRPNASAGVTV